MKKVTCHGCRVGLRTLDTKELLGKGWTIATSSQRMSQHMNLPCQRNHVHGTCDRGRAKHTAFYTPVFAKRVVDTMVEHDDWNQVAWDIHGGVDQTSSKTSLEDISGDLGDIKETQHGLVLSPEEREKSLEKPETYSFGHWSLFQQTLGGCFEA